MVSSDLQDGFSKLLSRAGKPIRLKYYTNSIGSIYDDDEALTISGTALWTSGIVIPINSQTGTYESMLMQQGRLINNDQKLYVHGSLLLLGSTYQVKVGLGSPIESEYAIVSDGIIRAEVQSQPIYKKVYIRRLTTGSFLGE